MKTQFKIFGKRLNMAPQANRRTLVWVVYGLLAMFMTASWMSNPRGTDAAFISIVSGLLLWPTFGGRFQSKYYLFGSGLVEPFDGNEVLDRKRRSKWARFFIPEVGDEREVRNDERALRRRDHAHYVAFQSLGSLIALAFILKYFDSNSMLPTVLTPEWVNRIIFGILQISWIEIMSLPQAILLWTEPDMETDFPQR
jgi:hypothetical protein